MFSQPTCPGDRDDWLAVEVALIDRDGELVAFDF